MRDTLSRIDKTDILDKQGETRVYNWTSDLLPGNDLHGTFSQPGGRHSVFMDGRNNVCDPVHHALSFGGEISCG